jgi:hypothetical protein
VYSMQNSDRLGVAVAALSGVLFHVVSVRLALC